MYIDTGVENSSLYRAATAGLEAKNYIMGEWIAPSYCTVRYEYELVAPNGSLRATVRYEYELVAPNDGSLRTGLRTGVGRSSELGRSE